MKTFMTYGPANRLYEAAFRRVTAVPGCEGAPANAELLAALKGCDAAIKEREIFAPQIAQAREESCCDDIEIDDDPVLSVADDGVWVSAWIWIPTPERAQEEG